MDFIDSDVFSKTHGNLTVSSCTHFSSTKVTLEKCP